LVQETKKEEMAVMAEEVEELKVCYTPVTPL
jgi:hypothetical protein